MTSHYRRDCTWYKPEIIANKLLQTWGEEGLIWLDGDKSNLGRFVTLGVDPIDQICCRGLPDDKNGSNPFEALRNLSPGHWTGWLSYEAGAWMEPNNPWKHHKMATLWIGSHDPIIKFDLKNRVLWLEGFNKKRLSYMEEWLNKIEISNTNMHSQSNLEFNIPIDCWKWNTSKHEYSKNVSRIQNWIRNGDIFQANLTTSCETILQKKFSAVNIFQKLRQYNPAPFSGVVIGSGSASGEAVISASPERFLKVLPDGEIETRPIKGTRPRNKNRKIDAQMAMDLATSEKDRAENIMIVDLLRNDLGRMCKPGSIHAPQLVGLESYPQVHHLTSVIKGSLKENKTWIDLLEVCWPGGSISGAPKLRACQRLYELENLARGPYCGSLININWNNKFDSNIIIRSLMLKNQRLRAHAGCGIVADSDPFNEAEELNWKLLPLIKSLI